MTNRSAAIRAVLALGLALGSPLGCSRDEKTAEARAATIDAPRTAPPRTGFMETEVLPIDRIYHSMEGPANRIEVAHANLQWVTAIRAEVIDDVTRQKMGDEFFCHSQLQLLNGTRLLVMATGADEIRFPSGFAMPVAEILQGLPIDQRALTFVGMVLNNHEPEIDRLTRVRATVEFHLDQDFGAAPRPKKLYPTNLTMFVKDLKEYDPTAVNDDVTTHCALVGELPLHWMVPPGKQKTRYRYQDFAPEGRVHFGWVHMHNFGVYMRLTDVTTGELLWQADVEHEAQRDQIAKISHYSSVEGFLLRPDHVYEIEALYDNTTDHDINAMAMMMLYYHPRDDVSITFPGGTITQPAALVR